jgi:hypothetical protein
VVRVVFKNWSELSLLNIDLSRPGKVVRTDLKVAKNGSDFTLNNGPSCLYRVVRADLKIGLILH